MRRTIVVTALVVSFLLFQAFVVPEVFYYVLFQFLD